MLVFGEPMKKENMQSSHVEVKKAKKSMNFNLEFIPTKI